MNATKKKDYTFSKDKKGFNLVNRKSIVYLFQYLHQHFWAAGRYLENGSINTKLMITLENEKRQFNAF
jgi:hypothetical protein